MFRDDRQIAHCFRALLAVLDGRRMDDLGELLVAIAGGSGEVDRWLAEREGAVARAE